MKTVSSRGGSSASLEHGPLSGSPETFPWVGYTTFTSRTTSRSDAEPACFLNLATTSKCSLKDQPSGQHPAKTSLRSKTITPPRGGVIGYLPLIAMRFTFCCAVCDFGSVTERTPFLNEADTLSCSTSSTGMRRSNCP